MRSWMIGVISGIMPVALLSSLPAMAAVLLLPALSLLLLALSRHGLACYTSGLLLGLAVGLLHGHSLLERRPGEGCELRVVQVDGVVSSLPRVTALRKGEVRQRFEFSIDRIEPLRCTGPGTILLSYYGERPINPGERWRFHVKLKRPWGLANPGSFNIQSWYAQTGIDAIGSVRRKSATLLATAAGPGYLHHRLRQAISAQIARVPLGADAIAILRALTVADKSGMDKRLWRLFQQYGLNHLLVISGLHIGLVAGLGFLLGSGLGRLALLAGYYRLVEYMPGLLALFLATGYASLAGFSLSTNRALIMLASFVLASLLGRSSGSWNNLLLAAFLVLLLNPLAALGAGFWLSFGAVAWLLWLGLWQRGGKVKRVFYTHAGMSLLMIPLGGWWFGGASLVAAMANLLMVPLVGLFVVPLALSGALLQFQASELGDGLLSLAARPFEVLIPIAQYFDAAGDFNVFWQFSPSLPAVLLAIAGLAGLVIKQTPRVFIIAVLLALPLLLPRGRGWDDSRLLAKLTVLDVGQGTALVLQGPRRTLVYDTGGGDPAGVNMATTVILPYLRQQGISALDTLLVSHGDNDHSAGAASLLSALPVRQLLYGAAQFTGSEGGRFCRSGEAWQWPSGISFQILSPAGEAGLSSNNSSCVLQIEVGGLRLLLPGDIDANREKTVVRYWRASLQSDWLLAAHHGSISSTSLPWLKYVQAAQVVFSSGYGNAFGHPHPTIVQRTGGEGRASYSTSVDGALEIYFGTQGQIEVHRYRSRHKRYWY